MLYVKVLAVAGSKAGRQCATHQLCKISEDLGGLAGCILVKVKQLGVVINEGCCGFASQKLWVP